MANDQRPSDLVESLFTEALSRSSAERAAWLQAACRGDHQLQRRVERLLTSFAQAGDFLAGDATELLDDPDHAGLGGVVRDAWSDTMAELDGPTRAPGAFVTEMIERLRLFAPSDYPGALGRLGECEILELIGRGGMGVVYKAIDTRLQRQVAIKILHPLAAADETARRRFMREAQAVAAVAHDHVVVIHDVAEVQGLPYLVMQYVDGGSLQDKIAAGTLDLTSIVGFGMQIALGLAAAHRKGLIHRDIKPANMLIERETQQVRITDFGLACALDDGGLTKTGKVSGTPHYMSPEQAQDLPVDARSDLFSLGCVLYAMCTGKSPFEASSTMASLRSVCDAPHRSLRAGSRPFPRWLATLVDQLLAKDPRHRPDSAEKVAAELRSRWLSLQTAATENEPLEDLVPQTRGWVTGRVGWGLAGLAILATVGLAVRSYLAPPREGRPIQQPDAADSSSSLAGASAVIADAWQEPFLWEEPVNLGHQVNSLADEGQPYMSATGLSLIFSSNRPGGHGGNDIWECQRDSNEQPWGPAQNLGAPINTDGDDGDPCLSSDRLTIYFTSTRAGGQGSYDLWMAHRDRVDAPWQEPINLGPQVNSSQLDGGPCVSADELTLWFHSYRSAVEGSDIWFCRRSERNQPFGPAENAGAVVNAPGSCGESSCTIAADGSLLLWTQCVALDPPRFEIRAGRRSLPTGPVTSSWALDELINRRSPTSPWLSPDGNLLLFESVGPDGQGDHDLWMARRRTKS